MRAYLFSFAAAIVMLGCPSEPMRDRGPSPIADAGPGGVDSGRDPEPPPPPPDLTYQLEPLDPVLDLAIDADEAARTIHFTVNAIDAEGRVTPAGAVRFSIDHLDLGTIDATSGAFVANGEAGGTVEALATVTTGRGPLPLRTTITIRLHADVMLPGAPADVAARFAAEPVADAEREADVVYPLDGAVMPQNVYPPEVQWMRAATGDLFRIRLATDHAAVTAYGAALDASYSKSWQIGLEPWRMLAQTDAGEPVTITVDRLPAGSDTPIAGTPRTLRFARGSVSGTVYFVSHDGDHSIVRIDDGSNEVEEYVPGCVGCHSVSRSGRYMAARLGPADNRGAVYDLLSGSAPPATTYTPGTHWYRATWDKDDARLIVDTVANRLELVDPFTGSILAPLTGPLPSNALHPSWSPDGRNVSFSSNATESGRPGWEWFGRGDLSVLPVLGPDAFDEPYVVVRAADIPGGDTISSSTWSADAQIIAFAHGASNYGISREQSIYAATVAGTWTHLTRASSGSGTTLDASPVFSPFCTGGYCWLAFTSSRPYGNDRVGTRAVPVGDGTTRFPEQVWITGIRQSEVASLDEDPSEVAYRLPGQPIATDNLYAQWAARACRADSTECSVDSECCSGVCRSGMCTTPEEEECRDDGELCGGDGACCDGLTCVSNVCQTILF